MRKRERATVYVYAQKLRGPRCEGEKKYSVPNLAQGNVEEEKIYFSKQTNLAKIYVGGGGKKIVFRQYSESSIELDGEGRK